MRTGPSSRRGSHEPLSLLPPQPLRPRKPSMNATPQYFAALPPVSPANGKAASLLRKSLPALKELCRTAQT